MQALYNIVVLHARSRSATKLGLRISEKQKEEKDSNNHFNEQNNKELDLRDNEDLKYLPF